MWVRVADTRPAPQTVQITVLSSRRQKAIEAWRDVLNYRQTSKRFDSICLQLTPRGHGHLSFFTHIQIVWSVWHLVPKALLQKCISYYPTIVFSNGILRIQPPSQNPEMCGESYPIVAPSTLSGDLHKLGSISFQNGNCATHFMRNNSIAGIAAQWLAPVLRKWEVPVSNFGQETGYPHWDFWWFSSVSIAKCRYIISFRPRLLSSIHLQFTMHRSIIRRCEVWATDSTVK